MKSFLPWAVIQHLDYEGPGLIASEARDWGLELGVVRLDRGEALPAVDGIGGLIVMGGTMGVYDAAEFPFLRAETALIAAAVERGVPVLGVCLGAQLLAAALGAEVRRGPVFEMGCGEVALTAAGRADAVLGPGPALPVFHSHQDTFALPPAAARLAGSALYPHQAFRVNPVTYGLQFHFELDRELAAGWLPRLPAEHRFREERQAEIAAAGRGLMRRFLRVAAGEPRR